MSSLREGLNFFKHYLGYVHAQRVNVDRVHAI